MEIANRSIMTMQAYKPYNKLDAVSAAPNWDATAIAPYTQDSPVCYKGRYYRCAVAASTPGTWVAAEWAAVVLSTEIDAKAPLASPAFTGTPTAPTVQDASDSTTKVATTEFVQAVVAGGGGGGTKLDSVAAAPDYDATATYAKDEHVTHLGRLYYAKQAITTAEAWTAAHWQETDMTTPDATLDVTSQDALRVVAADGSQLWMQGYNLVAPTVTSSAATASNESVNYIAFAANAAGAVTLSLPARTTGKVSDFVLEVYNPALDSTAANYPSAFSDSATYAVGDRVLQDNAVWICTVAVETAGAWTGTSNWQTACLAVAGLDTSVSIVVPDGEDLQTMFTIEPGTMSEFYFTLTQFAVNSLPTYKVVKQSVVNGGGS